MLTRTALVTLVLAVLSGACAGADQAGPTAAPTAVEGTTARASSDGSDRASADSASTSVAFDSGGLALRGDLWLPAGPGPYPGIVLIHGSGPLDRDSMLRGQLAMSFSRPVATFHDLAAGLRDAGYMVLTYDKRTCGPFNDCADNGYPTPPDDVTIDAFADDAQAAATWLRRRDDVTADAVAVVGHSQGASFVPALLIDDPRLAAGVMLSAPFDPVDDLLAHQAAMVERLVARMQPPPPGAEQEITRIRRLASTVGALRTGGTGDPAQLGGASATFWRSWLRLSDGVPQLAIQAEQPLLVLTGSADTNVGSDQTDRWADTLQGPHDRVVRLDCVSHALNCLGTDDPLAVDPTAIDDRVDPRVVDAIVAFLDDTVR